MQICSPTVAWKRPVAWNGLNLRFSSSFKHVIACGRTELKILYLAMTKSIENVKIFEKFNYLPTLGKKTPLKTV